MSRRRHALWPITSQHRVSRLRRTSATACSACVCCRRRSTPSSSYSFGVQGTLVVLMDVNFSGTLIPLIGDRIDNRKLIADYVASLRQLSYWALRPGRCRYGRLLSLAGQTPELELDNRRVDDSDPARINLVCSHRLGLWHRSHSASQETALVSSANDLERRNALGSAG
jgi:hypothetical protein